MRILITGMEGFAGSHLAEHALSQRAEVHGTVFSRASRRNLAGIPVAGIHALDVTQAAAVVRLVKRLRPERIFHLAGQSNPSLSEQDPEPTLRTNILGTLHVLEAARALGPKTRVLVVGSAVEYGSVPPSVRHITEAAPARPENPYGVSKVCQDLLGRIYFQDHGLHVVRVRPFNHIGPRQAPGFVASDFASQIAAIERGRQAPVLTTGNLEVVRDFSDVRDIVTGYWLLLERGQAGEVYNLGSGRGIRVRDLLQQFLALSTVKIHVRTRPGKIRSEQQRKVASIARVRRATGWKPEITLEQTAKEILEYWRKLTPPAPSFPKRGKAKKALPR